MGTHRYVISIAAPYEVVYDLYADPRRHAEWESGNPQVSLIESVILPPRVVRQELARFKAIAERESGNAT